MTVQEAKDMIEELKAQGSTEEELVAAFYGMFTEDKITIDELGDLVQLVGYELTDEFRNMSVEDQKTKGWADEDELDEGSDGEEIKEEPKKDEGAEKGTDGADDGAKRSEDSEDSEEEQRAKAKKLFGLN